MNYAIVISLPVWAGSLAYYYLDRYKWFKGSKHMIEGEPLTGTSNEQTMEKGS